MIDAKDIPQCPACASDSTEMVTGWWFPENNLVMVHCNDCGRSTPWMETEEEALSDWTYNRGEFE